MQSLLRAPTGIQPGTQRSRSLLGNIIPSTTRTSFYRRTSSYLPKQHHEQFRQSSYASTSSARKTPHGKSTLQTFKSLYKTQEPISMTTAYDFPSAYIADHAGIDIILVGDSLATVSLGKEDTSEVLLEEMLLHCRSVARATKSAFTVTKPLL